MPISTPFNPLSGGASPTTGQLVTGTLIGLNGQTIVGDANGAWAITANGTNQDISLTPSGTGQIKIVAAADQSEIFIGRYNWPDATPGIYGAIDFRTADSNAAAAPFWRARRSRGTLSSPSAVQADDALTYFSAMGFGATQFNDHSDASMEIRASATFTDTSHPTYTLWRSTGVGSTTKQEYMRLLANGDLNLGTPGGSGEVSPERGFHAWGSGRAVVLDTYSATENALFIGRRARGTYGAATAVQNGDILVVLGGRGYHNSGDFSSGSRAYVRMLAAESWTISAQGTYMELATTPTGSTTAATALTLDSSQRASFSGTTDTTSSGTFTPVTIARTYNQTGTAGSIDLLINRTETALGSGDQMAMEVQVAGVRRWSLGSRKVTTTDATVTTLATIPVPASTTLGINGYVVARRTGGAAGTAEDGAYYRVETVYKNAAGTATNIGTTVTAIGESQAAWDVTVTQSSGDVLIRVQGAADNNVSWVGVFHRNPISS